MTYEETPDEFGYFPEQYCSHGQPDDVYCDLCADERLEAESGE